MLNRLQNSIQLTWDQIYDVFVPKRPKLDAAQQTRLSWANRVKSYADVPEVFKDFFEPFQEADLDFPYTVRTPSFEGFLHPTTEKLICDLVHSIYVLERKGGGYDVQRYPLEKISYVRFRAVLLDADFKICGMTTDGKPGSSTLRFNAVTDYLFEPLLARMRQAGGESLGCVKFGTGEVRQLVPVELQVYDVSEAQLAGRRNGPSSLSSARNSSACIYTAGHYVLPNRILNPCGHSDRPGE